MIKWFRDHYLTGAADVHDWRASPARAGTLIGLPPAYVLTAGADPLRDEGDEYARRLKEAGVPVTFRHFPGQFHGFFTMGKLLQQANVAASEIGAWLRALTVPAIAADLPVKASVLTKLRLRPFLVGRDFLLGANVGYGWSSQAIALSGTGAIRAARPVPFHPRWHPTHKVCLAAFRLATITNRAASFSAPRRTLRMPISDIAKPLSLAPVLPRSFVTTGEQKVRLVRDHARSPRLLADRWVAHVRDRRSCLWPR